MIDETLNKAERLQAICNAERALGSKKVQELLALLMARGKAQCYVGDDAEVARAAALAQVLGEIEGILDTAPPNVLHLVRRIVLEQRLGSAAARQQERPAIAIVKPGNSS